MTLTAGTTRPLKVSREVSPYGYFLVDEEGNEVLLHYTELVGSKPSIGATIDAFIFFDSEDRLAATMKKPLLQLGELARLKVADVHPKLGCFLEMGLGRQLLLPLSELPESIAYRPLPGDEVFVVMKHDKIGRLVAKIAFEEELSPLVFAAPEAWRNQWVEGWVTKTLQMGSFVILDGGVVGFGVYGMIPAPERTRALRLGERVRARVTFIREDGRVNLSMSEKKEVGRELDADRLLAFLKERPNGGMPYSDETDPDIIKQRFGISKSAFKRALGKLLREGLITQKGSWTYLTEDQAEDSLGGNEASTGADGNASPRENGNAPSGANGNTKGEAGK
jgi:predicted RNA-binding protein (virulence factor B family)